MNYHCRWLLASSLAVALCAAGCKPGLVRGESAEPVQQSLPASGLSRDSILKVQGSGPPVNGFDFIFFGDNRDKSPVATEGDAVFGRCIALINRQQPVFVIHGGDFTYDNSQTNWQKMMGIEGDLHVPLMTVVGNHDVLHSRTQYESTFAAPNPVTGLEDYSFDYGGVRFIALDDANGTIMPQQFTWLQQQLHTRQAKVVMAHMPPRLQPWTFHSIENQAASDQLLKLLDDNQVDLVLLSHIHLFDDSVRRGRTQYIVSGGAGAPYVPNAAFGVSAHHVVLIHADRAGKLTYKMVSVDS